MTDEPVPTPSPERLDGAALRRLAAEEGPPISDRLLETLRGQGLVPRPTRISSRGRSPVWVYPPVAAPQLLALLRWREQTKDPDTLRLLLWVDGYAVPTSEVRAALVRCLDNARNTIDRELRTHAERAGLDIDRVEDREQVLQEAGRIFAAKRGQGSIPRRGRVKADERAHAVTVLLHRFLLDLPIAGDIEQEAQKIEKVLGMTPGRTREIEGSGPWLTGPAAPLLEVADVIALPRLLDTARTATDGELEMARQAVRAMFRFLPFVVRLIGLLTGDDNYIGLALIRNADKNPELLVLLTPMIVGLLRAGWAANIQIVTEALKIAPELDQQMRQLMEMPSTKVRQNMAAQPPEAQDLLQRVIDAAMSEQLEQPPGRPT